MPWARTKSVIGVLVMVVLVGMQPARAQNAEPRGRFVQLGAAALPGLGLSLGSVSARTLYTREIHLLTNIEPAFRSTDDQIKVAVLIGFSFRVFGVERLIGNAGYRGFDIDLGLRAGPGLSFSSRDTKVDKNRRFVLHVDPVIRISRASNAGVFFAEVGAVTPSVRVGAWIPW